MAGDAHEGITEKSEKPERWGCEVHVEFTVPKDKADHIFAARDELGKAGIGFDSGGSIPGPEDDTVTLDWEWDWSLSGPIDLTLKKISESIKEEGPVPESEGVPEDDPKESLLEPHQERVLDEE